MAQPRSKAPLYITLAAAGGVGYYLYSAGGSPKVAEKKFEADLASASAKIKSEIPGRSKEAEKTTEKWGAEAGAKFDSATEKARAELAKAESLARTEINKAENKFDQYRADANKKIAETDRKIEQKAAEAKSGISSWFGFGGK